MIVDKKTIISGIQSAPREPLNGKRVAFLLHSKCCVRPLPNKSHLPIISECWWKSTSVSDACPAVQSFECQFGTETPCCFRRRISSDHMEIGDTINATRYGSQDGGSANCFGKYLRRQHDTSANNQTLLRKQDVFAHSVVSHSSRRLSFLRPSFARLFASRFKLILLHRRLSPWGLLKSHHHLVSYPLRNSRKCISREAPGIFLWESHQAQAQAGSANIVFNKQSRFSCSRVFARPFYFWVLPFNVKLGLCFFDDPNHIP